MDGAKARRRRRRVRMTALQKLCPHGSDNAGERREVRREAPSRVRPESGIIHSHNSSESRGPICGAEFILCGASAPQKAPETG
jgi:hypothetical protein